MKVTVKVSFLRSESNNSLHLHFGCFSREVKNFFPLLPNIIYYLSRRCVHISSAVNSIILSRHYIICHKFKIMSITKTYAEPTGAFSFKLHVIQRHFF